MSALRLLYLALALAGALHPLSLLLAHGLPAAVARFSGPSETLITAIALGLWAIAETWVRRNWLALIALPVTFLLGPGCGLPLYLFLRTAPVR